MCEQFSLQILIGRGLKPKRICFVFDSLFNFEGISLKVGVDCDEVPPVPIPNTEVKLICAEDSWLETACENR